jgi:hypothetical protein
MEIFVLAAIIIAAIATVDLPDHTPKGSPR